MKKYSSFIVLILTMLQLTSSCKKTSSQDTPQGPTLTTHGIIPLPRNLDLPEGTFTLNHDFTFITGSPFTIASAAAQTVLTNTIESFKTSATVQAGQKSLQLVQDKSIKDDAYKLVTNADGILITAGNEAGAFWAVQSLKQYLWTIGSEKKPASLDVPFLTISDEPKYKWRGFHLDVSRHLFTKEYILKIIDWLSYYKFNKLHLHLTDDQGWRIESKKFPLLNEVGSWRTLDSNDSICIRKAQSNPDFAIDPRFIKVDNGITQYGGYYTRDDLIEIISYAEDHFIEIIPEIDMPGHMSAAIRAYPQLSCTGSSGWGKEFSYPICPCNDEAFNLVFQIWDEVAEIFPSKYVHIGADEVEKDTWNASLECQDFMKVNNLLNVKEIQSFFVGKLQKHLEKKGKTVIAWDDVTDGKLSSDLKIMYWRDWVTDAPAKAAANGNEIIFTRWDMFYLSSPNTDESLKAMLEFDVNKAYPSAVTSKIIGFQGCVWTEEIPSEAIFESQIFPRIQALSEVNWSESKNLYSFNTRMEPHFKYLKANNVHLKTK
jgi:hexosaminidase